MLFSIICVIGENYTNISTIKAIELEQRFDFFFESTIAIIGVIITVISIMIAITSSYYKIEIIELFINDIINILILTFSGSVFIFAYIIRFLNTLNYNLIFSTIFYLILLALLATCYIFYTFYILSSQRQTYFINKIAKIITLNLREIIAQKKHKHIIPIKKSIIFNILQLFDMIDINNEKINSLIIRKLEDIFITYRNIKKNNQLDYRWFVTTFEEKQILEILNYSSGNNIFFEEIIVTKLIDKLGYFIDKKDDSLIIKIILFMNSIIKKDNEDELIKYFLKIYLKIISVFYEKEETWKIDKTINGIEEIFFVYLTKGHFDKDYIKLIIKDLQFYSILFYQKNKPVIIDKTSFLVTKMIIYLDHNDYIALSIELLMVLLNIDRPLMSKFNLELIDLTEQKGRKVRISQICVALYYFYKIDELKKYKKLTKDKKDNIILYQSLINIIYNDFIDEPLERIQLIRNELESNFDEFYNNIIQITKLTSINPNFIKKYITKFFEKFNIDFQNFETLRFKKELSKIIKQNPYFQKPLGVILVENGFISKDDLLEILSLQTGRQISYKEIFHPEKINKKTEKLLGEILIENNKITKEDLKKALEIQQNENKKILENIFLKSNINLNE